MKVKINLDFLDDRSIIRIELLPIAFVVEANVYYWAIDVSFDKDDGSTIKVLKNLKNTLNNWLRVIESIGEHIEDVFLPFEFEDEYVGLLKISPLSKSEVLVEYVITRDIQGYSISPSKCDSFNINNITYEAESDSFQIGIAELLEDFRLNISVIDKYLLA